MSLSSMAYRQVDTIVSTWTKKYQYHISLLEGKQDIARFMVQFSLTKPEKPIPIGTVRVYFTCVCDQKLAITFRFEKDSLIHSVDKTIRHGEIEKWIDDCLEKKLLVRETVFYLGTSYEETRVTDVRLDKLLQKPVIVKQPQFVYIHPDLLSDQQRSIEIMQKPKKDLQKLQSDLKDHFREVDTQNIGVVTRPQFICIIEKLGIKLSEKEQNQVLNRVDETNTGLVQFQNYAEIVSEMLEAMEAKIIAVDRLQIKKEDQTFFSILTLINDDVQDIQAQLFDHFKKQDEDETGQTNISQVKVALQNINKRFRQQNKPQPLSPIEMAEITKILTQKYGYKNIPYEKIHGHIVEHKIKTFSNGLVNAQINKLQLYIRQICDKYDVKKFGRISKASFIEAIEKSQKIKLTQTQIYLLENIIPVDEKGQMNYVESSKFVSEVIKKFYIHSSKRKQ